MNRDNPFDIDQQEAYLRWREDKLARQPQGAEELIVEIADPASLRVAESRALLERIGRANMAVFACKRAFSDHATLKQLASAFGLQRLDNHLCTDEDGISDLQVSASGHKQHYIPYSNRLINWHTDGYYNPMDKQIHGMLLYCVRQAAEGGGNRLMDHEMAYLLLRDQNPDWIRALSQADAMAIPANDVEGEVLRDLTQGPVFSQHQPSGQLHMRYTARKRNILWQPDAATQEAIKYLENLLLQESPPVFKLRLEAGQGLLCNNVLHYRDSFRDDPTSGATRLYYRARYYDRISH